MTEPSKKNIREEVKWLIFILLFIGSIAINYFTVVKRTELNSYRIEKIEQARKEAWSSYNKTCEQTIKNLKNITEDLILIKVKLGIEN